MNFTVEGPSERADLFELVHRAGVGALNLLEPPRPRTPCVLSFYEPNLATPASIVSKISNARSSRRSLKISEGCPERRAILTSP